MTSKREVDPEARRLLAELDHIESGPWPEGMEAYAETLQALAIRCERKPGKAEMYRWMLRELAGVIYARDGKQAGPRLDAAAVMATTSAGLLMQWRATLDPEQRPNLRSMAGALLGWRGKDVWVTHEARHRGREAPWIPGLVPPVAASQEAAVIAAEVCRALVDGGPPDRALLRLGLGDSIAEAARRTGASRQQVYRARGRLLEQLGLPVEGRPIGGRGAAGRELRDEPAAEDPEPDGGREAPGSPVPAAGRADGEARREEGTDGVGQVIDLDERSSVLPLDPPPVRPRPPPRPRRPRAEVVCPTLTAGADQGRIGGRRVGERAAGVMGRGYRVRSAVVSDPARQAGTDQSLGLGAIR